MVIQNIRHFLKQNKKIFINILFFTLLFFSLTDSTFAANTFDDIKQSVSLIGEGLLKGISLVLALLTFLVTMFLSPSWLNGSFFGLNGYFKDIWILVSNVVYFVFAFILIWIAFMNIIGKNADQYQLKQALPKFIVGILIVPFSWFLVQFILSISAILTVASLSLPFDTFSNYKSELDKVVVPQTCVLNITSFQLPGKDDSDTDGNKTKSKGFIDCDYEETGVPLTNLSTNGDSISSIYGIISMYTYGVLSLDRIDDVDSFDLGSIQNMGDLIIKIVFDVLFVLIYFILMAALGLVLMIRGIYIWIYIMISPIFGLMHFFGKNEGGGEGFFGKFNIKEFIALAMVPVYTMLALSFGLLFMFVIGKGMTSNGGVASDNGISISDNLLKVGKFELIIQGPVSSISNTTGFLSNVGGTGLGIIGSLILKIFGIVVLWGTVMAAMRTSQITKAIIEPLHSFGSKIGQIATSAPGNIPIFGGQSANSMSTAASTVQSSITTAQNTKGTELGQKFMGGSHLTKDYQKLKTNVGSDVDTSLENVKKVINKAGFDEIVQNSAGIDALSIQLKRLANNNGFKDKDKAIKLIDDLEAKGVGNANLVDDILSKLDAIGVSPGKSILGGTADVKKGEVKDHFGKGGDRSTTDSNKESKADIVEPSRGTYSNGNIQSVRFDNVTINLTEDGKIKPGFEDNFARSIDGKDKSKISKLFNNAGVEFDELVIQTNGAFKSTAIKENSDGKIEIDISDPK